MVLFWLLVIMFIIVCILLGFFILIQSDKGGGISGAIGGGLGGASSLLGTQDTANFLTRATVVLASAFLVLCIIMSVIVSHQTFTVDKSVLQKRAEKQQNYSPSSVLGGQQGLPIKQGDAGAAGATASPGLPMATPDQAAPAQQAAPAGATTQPAQAHGLPSGAIPIGTPDQKKEGKK
jgi:preprotein translocase subunit SecG